LSCVSELNHIKFIREVAMRKCVVCFVVVGSVTFYVNKLAV